MPDVVFYYDIVCPYAYMASQLIEAAAERCRNGSRVVFRPVLLGALYKATSAPQGKDGSASDVMPASKKAIAAADLALLAVRYNIPLRFNPMHPVRSLNAMRLLAGTKNDAHRRALTHALYRAYWVDEQDISSEATLQRIAQASLGAETPNVQERIGAPESKAALERNTDEALSRGAFGVPSFWVNDRLFWGADRLTFVERALGNANAHPLRLRLPSPSSPKRVTLTVFHDFSSPWSYLGSRVLDRTLAQPTVTGLGVQIVVDWVPILLGALFKEIGTPNVPALAMSEAKRNYYSADLQDWLQYRNASLGGEEVAFAFPSAFPLRTVVPCRVAIAAGKANAAAVTRAIYLAAWTQDKDVGSADVLKQVLDEAGFDGAALILAANDESVKQQLKDNTSRAVAAGACGVPSYQVDTGTGPQQLLWGQDHLNIVADQICGWSVDQPHAPVSKL
ncbi:DSBA oxidoreductase [Capsaspora owczarzaki ATCC 30864]|uniref:DSBA oxidoreductase n=1 Tax=Capsaspora owczarzaki (strain ATCC 30864) TaxID=595528 RepID=A0A0D2UES3_CAPO3|nr:DSBA oxidoreductase [Capsaspora owczarzaki ATCC 30864]KJE93596.1 DSBA oxidoreductase [Capsaspora owczarzaki ATCC 30864]|eukprot:XP_004348187.1 DSBA oxidoreductase [Capsaspora owczarzaki ATCC 30864]